MRLLNRSVTFPIDAVYTWVDGNDPEHKALREKYAVLDPSPNRKGMGHMAFTNHDELKFSLRSLERHAPWIRQVHIVTNGQIPSWLRLDHPKLNLVRHDQIFRDPQCLPVFNSQAIEANLARIPDLSEHFLYFCDDNFLGDATSPLDFFTADGKLRFFGLDQYLPEGKVDVKEDCHISGMKTACKALNETFGHQSWPIGIHQVRPYRKSVLEECERLFADQLKLVSTARFRGKHPFSIQAVVPHVAIRNGKGVLSEPPKHLCSFLEGNVMVNEERILAIWKSKAMLFCINDGIGKEYNPLITHQLHLFLEEFFPGSSSFETETPRSAPVYSTGNFRPPLPQSADPLPYDVLLEKFKNLKKMHSNLRDENDVLFQEKQVLLMQNKELIGYAKALAQMQRTALWRLLKYYFRFVTSGGKFRG